jgi:hypothetical protein
MPPDPSADATERDPEDSELDEIDRAAKLEDDRPARSRPEVVVRAHRDVEGMLELDMNTLDPDFHYKWVHDSPLRIARHRLRGYIPVQASEGVGTVAGIDAATDGVIRVGDTILMKCPRERVRQREENNRRLAESRLAAPKKKFLSDARQLGADTITDKEG